MSKLRQWEMMIGGKKYMFESRTIKGAERKAKRLAGALLKLKEVK